MEFYKIEKKVARAIFEFDMINDGDIVLLGVSGGKDSLALVELLGARQKIYKPKFTVLAAHISLENMPYQSDLEYLDVFCKQHGVEFIHGTSAFDPEARDKRKSTCFLCSWTRRKRLFELADEYKCNKIALGHHQDDILETLLMNQIFQGSFATMPPKLKMDKFDMTIIRPMALLQEKELIELAEERKYKKQIKNCPYEKESNRADVKKILKEMEKLTTHAKPSLCGSMRISQSQ